MDSRLLSGSNKLHTEPMKPFVGLVFLIFNMRALDGSVTTAFSSTGFLWISDCKEPSTPGMLLNPCPEKLQMMDGQQASRCPLPSMAPHLRTPPAMLIRQALLFCNRN